MSDTDKPAPEPVAWMSPGKERLEFARNDTVYGSHTIPLYAHPPQRKPLTDEEIVRLDEPVAGVPWDRVVKFVRWIERAHGIGGEE